ncbi:MAG: hypothetical protein ACKVT2_06635 [Saprospiraceae bacterium]
MTNTYLVAVIKAFRPKEREELGLFLQGPYENRGGNSQELLRLYQIILAAAPEFSEDSLKKEDVYEQLFPNQIVVAGKLEKLMADLNKIVRKFALAQNYFAESNEKRLQVDWATWLREHGMKDRSLHTLSKLKTQNNLEKVTSLEKYYFDLLIAEEEHRWESTYNQVKGGLNIPALIHQIDLYYHNYRIERINRYLLQKKGAQLPDIDFGNISLDSYLKESILLQISYKVFEIFSKDLPSIQDTQGLIEFLKIHEKSLSYEKLDDIYSYIRSSCTMLINAGNLNFVPILHQIHIDNLARGFLFYNGEIPSNTYLNLVQIATRAKEHAWAIKFTEDYKGMIVGGDEDQFYYQLNKAQYLFAVKQFDDALDYLPDAPSSTHYHHIIRRLELKIYYEMGSDLLEYKIDAFRKFIERTAPKSLAANIRTMHLNFLYFLVQLNLSLPKDKIRSARLIERIEEKKLVAERAWLLEKAKELG